MEKDRRMLEMLEMIGEQIGHELTNTAFNGSIALLVALGARKIVSTFMRGPEFNGAGFIIVTGVLFLSEVPNKVFGIKRRRR